MRNSASIIHSFSLASIQWVLASFFMMGADLLRAQNLVPNGGFESGFTGWSNNTSGGAAASFSQETAQPYAGAKAMKVAVTNPGAQLHNVQTLGPTFTLPTGTPTAITFRARAATAGTTVRFVMQASIYRQREFTLSTSWEYFTWLHTTEEANPRLRIQYRAAGTVWLDEISVVSQSDPGAGLSISIDPAERHQTMDGIGGALTWYSSRVLSSPHRDTLEQLIFDDLGLDIIRLKNWYYPANYPSNKSTANIPSAERTNHNANQTFYNMAKENGRDIRVLLSSWSPPANLKTNGSRQNGGTLTKDANGNYRYADLAQYWVDALDNTSWTPDYLSFQNEPGWVAAHETCEFAPTQTAMLAGYDQALNAIYNRIRTRPNVPVLIGPESESMNAFFTEVIPLRTRSYVGINAFHNYNIGDAAAIDAVIPTLNRIRDESETTNRPNWMSEFSKGEFNWLETAKVIHNTLVEANSSAYIFWKLVWGDSTNPDEIMINVDGAGNYVVGDTFYAIKHYSKHVARGDQRIGVTGSNTNVRASGYINPAGNRISLVVLNTGATDAEISLRTGGLPIASATAFRTRQYDIGGFPYRALGAVNLASNQILTKNSITTYVIELAETLNPYNPALLRIDGVQHYGNRVTVAIPAQPGHGFILWKSATLAPGSWQKVANAVVTESGGQLMLTDPNPVPASAFYRIQRDTGL